MSATSVSSVFVLLTQYSIRLPGLSQIPELSKLLLFVNIQIQLQMTSEYFLVKSTDRNNETDNSQTDNSQTDRQFSDRQFSDRQF